MKKIIALISFFVLVLLQNPFAQTFIKRYGGMATDLGSAAVQMPDGGFAIASVSESFGNKALDMALFRTDFEGKLIWTRTFGGNFNDQALDIAATPDGGLVLVGFSDIEGGAKPNNQFYAVKVDANGNELWSRKFGDANDNRLLSVTITKLGSIAIAGTTDNGTDYDAYIATMDGKGNLQWEYKTGGVNNQEARDIVEVIDGYVVTGVVTTTDVQGNLDKNVLLAKVTKTGQGAWYKTFGGIDLDEGNALTITNDGGFLVAGRTKKNIDILALRTDSGGNELWSVSFGNPTYEDDAFGVVANNNGSFMIAGGRATNALNIDAYLLNIDDKGVKKWERSFGNLKEAENFNNIITTRDGGYFMTGTFGDLTNDVYCVKTDANGKVASSLIKGKVFFDKTANCKLDNGETPLADWLINIKNKNQNFYAYTAANGEFQFPADTGNYEVSVLVQNSYWKKVCQTSATALIDSEKDTVVLDFPVRANIACPNMEVTLSAPKLTRCALNNFNVSFCNRGTETANASYIIVELDEFFEDISFNLAGVKSLGGNKYRCELGNVPAGVCGKFSFSAYLDKSCNTTVFGQTHTIKANIYPDSICTTPNSNWDGSSLDVTAKCQNNKVIFTVKNVGKNTSTPKNNIVIEDDLVFKNVKSTVKSLLPGESEDFEIVATGKTYRMIVEQAAGHPGNSFPTAAIEGCGGVGGTFSIGYVLQFNENDGNPFVSTFKMESSGVANKNEKIGFPKGFQKDRFVGDSTVLDYQISFKNTTGKTVTKVTVIDTVSNFLDILSLHEVLSSHDYMLSFPAINVLQFTFDNINLPDSTANTLLSNGFIRFKLLQKSDKPDNTVINNRAYIRFDEKMPITSNLTKHTVKKNLKKYITSVRFFENPTQTMDVKVFPNPFSDYTHFEVIGAPQDNLQLEVFDLWGKKIKSLDFDQNQLDFERGNLDNGIYLFNIRQQNRIVQSGKIVVQ
jgi:Secretion system C-terminal sorting domain